MPEKFQHLAKDDLFAQHGKERSDNFRAKAYHHASTQACGDPAYAIGCSRETVLGASLEESDGGQNSEEILLALGMDWETIAKLRERAA